MAKTENTTNTERVALLSVNDIDNFRQKFSIPTGVMLRIPLPGDRPSHPRPGEIGLHTVAFDCGLRLPFHPFIRTVLAYFGLAPSQLTPNIWRHMIGAVILWRICSEGKDHITLDEFNFCYKFCYTAKTKLWFLYPRDGRVLVLDCPNYSARDWPQRFVLASGTDWEFNPKEGTLPRAPPVPKDWGFPDENKLKEPMISDRHKTQVYRALKFDPDYRSYKNLITPENVQKYLLDDIPALSSPSLHGEGNIAVGSFYVFLLFSIFHFSYLLKMVKQIVSLRLDHNVFPESPRHPKAKPRRRFANMEADLATEKLGSIARSKLTKTCKPSTLRTDHAPSNPSPFDRLRGLTIPVDLESSSSESSVQIIDKDEQGPSILYKDDSVFERMKQLLTPDKMKETELGFDNTLQKGISYSAKVLATMLTLRAQFELELKKKQVSKQMETSVMQKAHIAYLNQLEIHGRLSEEMGTIKNKLAKAGKSLKAREDEIYSKDVELRAKDVELQNKDAEIHAKDGKLHAKDVALHAKDVDLQAKEVELRTKDAELRAKDEELHGKNVQIQALKEAAVNAVQRFKESNEYENLMGQWFLQGYDAFHSQVSQTSSLSPYADWPTMESFSGGDREATRDSLPENNLKGAQESEKLIK